MNTLSRAGALVALAVIAAIAAPVVVLSAAAGAPTSTCSIATMSKTDGVQVAMTPAKLASDGTAVDTFKAAYPEATIVESSVDLINAPNVPPIDGHTVTVVAFTEDGLTGAGGQAGVQMGQYTVGCGLAFYDAGTGEYLASVRRLDPASP